MNVRNEPRHDDVHLLRPILLPDVLISLRYKPFFLQISRTYFFRILAAECHVKCLSDEAKVRGTYKDKAVQFDCIAAKCSSARMQRHHTQQFQGAVRLQNEIPFEELNEEEQWRIEHAKLHEKHRGHEQMHMEIFLILIITLVVAQIALVQWKKRHFKSYQLCTLLGMWLIPVFICIQRYWWRFLMTWIVYSLLSTVIWYRATRPQISGKTPRLVYKWFLFLHKLSYVLGIAGYIFIMFTLVGLNHIFAIKARILMDAGLLLLFYGLYYGVLGRDFAHICTDRIASKIGYYTEEGLPKKILEADVCAVCGNHLEIDDTETDYESTYRLSCGHLFHEFCIRGWCVIGKQQTCPYCKEKVDLKRMFKHPWQKPHLFYGQLLDWIRYLVAWQPLIVTFVKGVNTYFGLE